jgi:hypothetical protein
MMLEGSISLTLMAIPEVSSIIFATKSFCIVPIWKAPTYNSPYMNWKRGMYAMSTGLFVVSIWLASSFLILVFDQFSLLQRNTFKVVPK